MALLSGLPGCTQEPQGFGPAPPPTSPTEEASPAPSPSPPTLRVRAPGGLRFSPELLRMRPGSTSAVEFHNLDQQPHTFVVDELNVLMLAGPGQRLRATVACTPTSEERSSSTAESPGIATAAWRAGSRSGDPSGLRP